MTLALRDPVSGLTHLTGAFFSTVGLCALVNFAMSHGDAWHVASFAVFGLSLTLMYAMSSLYHLLPLSEDGVRFLKRLDHMAIFILIAGTYTPFCLVSLRSGMGWTLFSVVWAFAAAGVIFKLYWLHAPRWLSTVIYIGMGWISVFAIGPLVAAVPTAGMVWLAAGGLFYSVGGLVYGFKRPDPFPKVFGFHEIWHLFVIAGSFCHFWAIYRHVLPAA